VNFEFRLPSRGCAGGLGELWAVTVRLLTYQEGFGSVWTFNVHPASLQQTEQC
jgi:hypothetical protein